MTHIEVKMLEYHFWRAGDSFSGGLEAATKDVSLIEEILESRF
jgi:hypothetical protein